MRWDRISKTCMQLISKTAAVRLFAPRTDAERVGPSLAATPYDDAQEAHRTEPYIPANNARLSESSLHFSC